MIIDEIAFAEARDVLGERFIQILEYYCEDAESYLQALESAVSQSNWTEAANQAHTLKSSSQQYGVLEVAEIAKRIELNAREGNTPALAHLAEELRERLDVALTELRHRSAVTA